MFCCSNFCKDLPPHSHSENSLKNELLDNLLQPQLSQAILGRERTFKQNYSSTIEWSWEQTALSHAYCNRFKLGHHLEVGQKVLYENHKQDITRSQKHQQRRLGLYTVTKRITNTTYQIQDKKDTMIIKTVHRNHFVEYYPKEGSLPAMIEKYVPSDHQNDNFYQRSMKQRSRDLNNPSTTEEHDSSPFLIEPLRSFSSTNKPERPSMHSKDSGITSPLVSSRTPVLSSAISVDTSSPHPSSSQHAKTAHLSPREHLSQIQQFVRNSCTRMARNSAKLRSKEPKCNRSQSTYTESLSVLRTITREGYKLWSPLYYCYIFVTFVLHAPIFPTRSYCFYLIPKYIEQNGSVPSLRTIQLNIPSPMQLLNFYKLLQKDCEKLKIICRAIPEKAAQ